MTASTTTRSYKVACLPRLWVPDALVLKIGELGRTFDIRSYKEIENFENNGGDHYIVTEPNTSEAHAKALAWRLQDCKIYSAKAWLDDLAGAGIGAAAERIGAKELTLLIWEYAQPLKEWARWIEGTRSLSPADAADIATAAIRFLPDSQKLIELAQLRQRSGVSEWEWGNIVKSLEAEFQAELKRRGKADPDERLRLELLALSKEADPIRRVRRRAEICSHYRIRAADVDMLCQCLEKQTAQSAIGFRDAEEIFEMKSQGLQWLIPELLPRGETVILAAAPKCGKSLLAIDVAIALATGESDFLGQSMPRSKVLLISVDESLQSTRSKLIKRGMRRQDKDFLSVLDLWTINQLDVLEKKLEDYRPDIVIIDSLRRISHGSPISENSAEFADNIYTLKELIGRYGASGILIHHANKNNEAMGVDKLRGSSSIAAAVWGTWILEHIPKKDPNNKKKLIIDPTDPTRSLSIFPRDAEGQTFKIEFNPEDNSWMRLDAEIQQEQQTMRKRILGILQLNRGGLSGKEIIELLNADKGIYTELNRMVNKLLVTCKPAPGDKRYNLYFLPLQDGDTPPPPPCDLIVEYVAEALTAQGLNNSQQNSQQVANNGQQVLTETNLLTIPSLDTASNSEIVNNSQAKEGGVCTSLISTEPETKLSTSVQEDARPPVGAWVKIEGRIAKVIKHYPDASEAVGGDNAHRVILDGQPAGTSVYGVYRVSSCSILSKSEILQLGLKG